MDEIFNYDDDDMHSITDLNLDNSSHINLVDSYSNSYGYVYDNASQTSFLTQCVGCNRFVFPNSSCCDVDQFGQRENYLSGNYREWIKENVGY